MRRNTVLALSTAVVMAIIAALLVFKPFGGGSDDIAGVSVTEGDVPEITVNDPEALAGDVKTGDPKLAVLSEGDGRQINTGDYFSAGYLLVDGLSGETLDSTYAVADPASGAAAPGTAAFQFIDAQQATSAQTAPGLPAPMVEAMKDVKVGDTVLVALTAGDFFGDQYAQFGYTQDQVFVFYFSFEDSIDVEASPAPKGAETALPAGVPAPVVDGDKVTGLDGAGAAADAPMAIHTLITGEGKTVEDGAFVYANYVGQVYPDGEVFDSSFERGEPALFSLNGVIACWTEQLPGQTVGSRVVLTCPADVAYGEAGGGGGLIPPNATLSFVVDIVGAL